MHRSQEKDSQYFADLSLLFTTEADENFSLGSESLVSDYNIFVYEYKERAALRRPLPLFLLRR